MKSKGREFAGNCSSNPPNLHERRTTSLPSAGTSQTMPKDCKPVCASMCSIAMGQVTAYSLKIRYWEQTVPASLFHFHLFSLQVCFLGTAFVRVEVVSLVTGEKHCSLLCPYLRASRPEYFTEKQALVYSTGKGCESSSDLLKLIHTLKINAESFLILLCALCPSLSDVGSQQILRTIVCFFRHR